MIKHSGFDKTVIMSFGADFDIWQWAFLLHLLH